MAKKVTFKDMMAQVEAQAQAMADLQAKLDAMTAQAAEAQAKAQAEAEKAKAAEAVLTEVAGNSSNVLAFDRDIHPAFNFGNYAIPGGEFAKEKNGAAFVKAQAVMTLDDILIHKVELEPVKCTVPGEGVFVFKDGKQYRRHFYRGEAYNLYKVELDDNGESHLVSNGWGEAPVQYEDVELPMMEGKLEFRVLNNEEIGQEVWRRLNRSTYRKPEYEFNLPYVKGNKLPEYKTPGGKPRKSTAGAGERKTTTPKGAKAAYITAFDQHAWGEFTLLRTDGLADRRKVQRDGVTVAAVIVKGNGYEITATEAKFQAAGISLDGAKKHGSRYVVTLDTPAQVMAFCQAQ